MPAAEGSLQLQPQPEREQLRCPYCHDAVAAEAPEGCRQEACGARYHPTCWSECLSSYGGCAIYGCGTRPAEVEPQPQPRPTWSELLWLPPVVVLRLRGRDRRVLPAIVLWLGLGLGIFLAGMQLAAWGADPELMEHSAGFFFLAGALCALLAYPLANGITTWTLQRDRP